jgi:predicted nuclease of predicted toxin-antitoxin system
MRVLLDECLPRKLKQDLEGHEVRTVPEMGWAGKKNGELLRLAAGRFDVFITVDRSLLYQQNLEGISIAVISLGARSNRLKDLRPLMTKVQVLLPTVRQGQIVRIGA